MALSGNCGQRGRPDHNGCTYEPCNCECHDKAETEQHDENGTRV